MGFRAHACMLLAMKQLHGCLQRDDLPGCDQDNRLGMEAFCKGSELASSSKTDLLDGSNHEDTGKFQVDSLDSVWQWAHPLTRGLSVTSTSWNKV